MSIELTCPVCQADLPLAGDERPGEELFCAYCGAPCLLRAKDLDDPSTWEAEEDF